MKTRMRTMAVLLCVSSLLVASGTHAEQQITADVPVTAVVVANCRLTVQPIAFGTYDPLGANSTGGLDSTASLILTCTRSTRGSIVLDAGQNAANPLNRYLTSGDQRLSYQIFRDAARTQTWGTGTDAFNFVSTGFSAPQQLTVYGRIPPGQEVRAGTYTDVVTASVDF